MSAISAVSVMNCSWTTVKRSSRAKPARVSVWSGATLTGLVFWMKSALTGGPPFSARASPVRIGPISLMSSSRMPGFAMLAPVISDLSSRQAPELEWKAPPPR